jgi:hypothetical protein
MKGKTGVNPIQTHLSGLSRFPGGRGLMNLPSPGFPGKILHPHLFCRKSLRACGSNDTFSPSSTGRTKTKVKGY